MHQAAHAIHIAHAIQTFVDVATDKNVAREKGLDHADNSATSGPLHPQTGVKHLQTKIALKAGCHNVLVLRLRSRAIPGEAGGVQSRNFRDGTASVYTKNADCTVKNGHNYNFELPETPAIPTTLLRRA